MEARNLANAIIEPNENDIDSSLLLSQLLISQVGPKEEEKVEQKLKQIPKDEYLCPKCLIPHEIRHINEETKEIEIHCANNCQAKYTLKDYLTNMCRISYYYYKCEMCKKKIQKNFKLEEGSIFKYCFECNKIICLQCYDFMHQKLNHVNIVPSNEIFNKCGTHANEDYIQFCVNCSMHLCAKCTFKPHKGHILVTLNSILPTQKEIDKFKNKKEQYINKKNELLKQIEELDNLIYINDIVLQTYLKHQKNYYYIINVLNLYNNDINNNNNNGIMNNNNINTDDDEDDEDFINRCKRQASGRNKYLKRKVNSKTDYDSDSKEINVNSKHVSSFNKKERNIKIIPNNDSNNQDKNILKDILTNIVKNKEKKEKSIGKDRYNRNEEERGNRNYSLERRRARHCSQDIRTNLDLEQGNQYLDKFIKEFGNKPFADKRKVELWGSKMGKEGLLVLLNNKHKFLEIEELILGRVNLNSLDFLENIFLDRIKILNLEYNRISSINIFQNLNMKNIETLNLSSNAISSIGNLHKVSMINIQYLYLSRNSIDSIDILSKVNFPKLKGLYLAENKISNISILSKVSFFNLSELFLNSNLISSVEVLNEVNFPILKTLNLSCNKISSIDTISKIPCLKLEEINLRMNLISNVEPLSKINLFYLKGLHLDNNKISDISCLSKAYFKNLQRLYLNNNLIVNISMFKFNPFNKLDTLTLAGNKINIKDRNNKKIVEDLEKKKIHVSY